MYFDFAHISSSQIAMLKENHLSILKISQNEGTIINYSEKIEKINKKNALIATNKYLIWGGRKYIYIGAFSKYNRKKEKLLYGNINCIQKIHDELFLASTDDGSILQIIFEQKNNCPKLEIKAKILYLKKYIL